MQESPGQRDDRAEQRRDRRDKEREARRSAELAVKSKQEADEARRAVEAQSERLEVCLVTARLNAYLADMTVARREIQDGNMARARALLERYGPASGEDADLRGFEWYYLAPEPGPGIADCGAPRAGDPAYPALAASDGPGARPCWARDRRGQP